MDKLNKIKKIISPIENDLDVFEKKLKEIINSQDNFLKDDLHNFMFQNPKRLRPIFVLLFAKILNINSPLVQNIALALELIHSASLIHDDIIDEEKTRRNHPTFFHKFNSKLAVLEGDLLLSEALEVLSLTNIQINKIFAKKIKETINGEINQNENSFKITDETTYLKKTKNKTGNLFIAGLEALFELGNFETKTKTSLMNFLNNYTLAFQIKNDIDDFLKDKADFLNGNYTLPVIYFCMENSIDKLNNNSNFEKYITKTIEKIEKLKNEALFQLSNIDDTIYKKALTELSEITLGS